MVRMEGRKEGQGHKQSTDLLSIAPRYLTAIHFQAGIRTYDASEWHLKFALLYRLPV